MRRHMKKLLGIGAMLLLSIAAVGCKQTSPEESSNYTMDTSTTLGYETVSMTEHFSYDIPKKWNVNEQTTSNGMLVLTHINPEEDEGMILSTYQADKAYDFSKEEDVKRYIDSSIKDDDTYHIKNEAITFSDNTSAEKITLKIKAEGGDRDAAYVLFNCDDGYGIISMISAADSDFSEKFDHIIESIHLD